MALTINPLSRQKLKLAKRFEVGDTTFQVVGRFEATSTGSYQIGKQFLCFSPATIVAEGAFFDVTIDPTAVSGKTNTYEYTVSVRGIDSDNDDVPPSLFSVDNQRDHEKGAVVAIVADPSLFSEFANQAQEAIDDAENRRRSQDAASAIAQRRFEAKTSDSVESNNENIFSQVWNWVLSLRLRQDRFETQIQSDIDAITAVGHDIVITVKVGDNTLIDISSGNWLDGIVERAYAGATSVNPANNTTTFYELQTGTGTLVSNTVEFTDGNYNIAKVVTGVSGQIVSITNYGPIYKVSGSGLGDLGGSGFTSPVYNTSNQLTSFVDEDSNTHTITYTADGRYSTINVDGVTHTHNYNISGEFTGITVS